MVNVVVKYNGKFPSLKKTATFDCLNKDRSKFKGNLSNSAIVVSKKRIVVSGKFLSLPDDLNENITHLSPIYKSQVELYSTYSFWCFNWAYQKQCLTYVIHLEFQIADKWTQSSWRLINLCVTMLGDCNVTNHYKIGMVENTNSKFRWYFPSCRNR